MRNKLIEDTLFLLLRIGLCKTIQEQEALSILGELSSQQWDDLINLSEDHGVFAIALDGLNTIHNKTAVKTQIKKESLLEWCGQVVSLEQRNKRQIKVMNELCGEIEKKLCPVLVFKGQAIATYYPEPLHRSCGDIDCYLFGNYEQGNALCQKYGASVDTSWYKHSQITYKGELFENHKYFVTTREGHNLKALNATLQELLKRQELESLDDLSIQIPTPMFNALFLIYHSLSHFVSEGLHLKLVLDWAQFVRKEQNNIDWICLYDLCERYHLRVFLDSMMDISVHQLGLEVESVDIVSNSKYSRKVLDSILYDDDFVFGVGENEWKQRIHLIRNVFKYRWKYKEIYEYNIFKHVCHSIYGFIFHSE